MLTKLPWRMCSLSTTQCFGHVSCVRNTASTTQTIKCSTLRICSAILAFDRTLGARRGARDGSGTCEHLQSGLATLCTGRMEVHEAKAGMV